MAQSQSTIMLVCAQCGQPFPKLRRGLAPRFCSQRCKSASHYHHVPTGHPRGRPRTDALAPRPCERCGQPFSSYIKSQRFCGQDCARASVRQPAISCPICGTDFNPTQHRSLYCSKPCAAVALSSEYAGGYCSLEGKQTPVWARQCIECKLWMVRKAPDRQRLVCSDECKRARARRQFHENWHSVRETNPIVVKPCKFCGKAFEVDYYAARRLYCSKSCSERAAEKSPAGRAQARRANQARRARMRGARVERVDFREVCERDGWKCGLCGQAVNKSLRYPHKKSASLDHILALAMGGAHSMSNVQLAHLDCNIKKGAALVGQLRLSI